MRPFFGLLVAGVVIGNALAACGSKVATASASVTGTVQGTTIDVASEVAAIEPITNMNCTDSTKGLVCTTTVTAGQAAVVYITNRATATCSALMAGITSDEGLNYANFNVLTLDIGNKDGPLAPGNYPIITDENATSGSGAALDTQNAKCEQAINASATAGSVTLTTVNESTIAGSYTVTFKDQGTFSGSFDVPTCPIPDSGHSTVLSADAAMPPCVP